MKTKPMVKGLMVAIIAAIGIGTFVFRRKKLSKGTSKQEENTNSIADDGIKLDGVYETLLEPDTEVSSLFDGKPKKVVVKFKDRSFWSVHSSLIISAIIIVAFAVCTVLVSITTQKAYSDRKAIEEKRTSTEQAASTIEQKNFEKIQILEIANRLDSIGVYIKAL